MYLDSSNWWPIEIFGEDESWNRIRRYRCPSSYTRYENIFFVSQNNTKDIFYDQH